MTMEHLSDAPPADPAGSLPAAPQMPAFAAEPAPPPRASALPTRSETYGSFRIDAMEFALSVEAIREVVTEPDSVSPVPLSAAHMVGLFNLRDMIIPLVDLRLLLELPPASSKEPGKVAIIENGDFCVGLLFDETGEVVYGEGATRLNFKPNEAGVKDVVVDGVLKFDGGRRSIQILNPYEILKIEKMPRISTSESNTAARSRLGNRQSCVSFELGHTTCAIDLRYVQEVLDVPEIESFCLTDGHVLGAITLRGHTIPVVDFRGILGREEPHAFNPAALTDRKLLVMNLPEGQIALLVYAIDSIIPYFDGEVMAFAKVALPRHDIVKGCLVNDEDEIIILIDGDSLIRDPELVNVARSCQEIHPPDTTKADTERNEKLNRRRTFILFSVDRRFALDVACVSEVIDRPEKLLAPPYALAFVEGILNLRGELITIVNPRRLYQLADSSPANQKVLIFIHEGQKYGMLVDSVDEIVMTNDASIIDVPSIMENESTRKISEDVSGCLSACSQDPDRGHVMILNMASLISRCLVTE